MGRKNQGKYKDLSEKEKIEYHKNHWKNWLSKNYGEYRKKNNEYQKVWRENNIAYFKKYFKKLENRILKNVRNTTNNAIRYGYLHRGICEICFQPRAEAHHLDYTKPFKIKWLCRKHHKQLHIKQK